MSGAAQRARRFTEALHALDRDDAGALDAMVGLFADDAELANAALDIAGETRRGRDGAHAFWRSYRGQFAEAETEFHQVTANDDAAGLFWTTRGKSPAGDALDYHGASLLVFDGEGRVVSFRGYHDTRQLTVETAPAASRAARLGRERSRRRPPFSSSSDPPSPMP